MKKNQPECTLSATNGLLKTEYAKTKSAKFQRLTNQSGERYVYLYCTQYSLERRRDEIILWADQLVRQLCWRNYETTIRTASTVETSERNRILLVIDNEQAGLDAGTVMA